MRGRVLAMAGSLVVFIVACGVPESGDFESINRRDIPFDLAVSTSTSTTTTTTTTTTTLPPPTTAALSSTTTSTTILATTTSLATEQVDIYFAAGNQLNSVSLAIARGALATQVLARLVEGPPAGDVGRGLRALFPAPKAGDPTISVTVTKGVAKVDLPGKLLEGMSATDERLLYGQIVLTLVNRPGIGQVSFTVDGRPQRVIKGNGEASEPGEAVAGEEYTQLLAGSGPVPTIASTTTTTAAPPPPDTAPPSSETSTT